MRILTWNVNVLRTCLDYHPFSKMPKKNVQGLLDELGAQIFCFQEHKTRRSQLEKSMACPGPYDGFWTFPRSKTGYSGTCTFVDSRYCVPLKAEEGITGLLLDDRSSTMRPPWTEEERIGGYVNMDEIELLDEVDGREFDPKKLDMEGRAVVCDFGLFVLFNLYCPNETNETRRPYKMNFLSVLQARVRKLVAQGREVIVAGDLNIMRSPLDSGEGGIRTSAEQHYQHPARRIFDDWCHPKGPMIDVVRESWPDRDDMFTCWNQKLDARPSNYGSRIDYIICTPGLRPWIKGGDILPKVFGSDHCPVYIDLYESIPSPIPGEPPLILRDLLNPVDRPPSTAPIYPSDIPREAPEPPRFATKFYEEFSGRQMTLKNLWAGSATKKEKEQSQEKEKEQVNTYEALTAEKHRSGSNGTGTPLTKKMASTQNPDSQTSKTTTTNNIFQSPEEMIANDDTFTPFSLARAAFNSLNSSQLSHRSTSNLSVKVDEGPSQPIDMTYDEDDHQHQPESSSRSTSMSKRDRSDSMVKIASNVKSKSAKTTTTTNNKPSQPKLASFWKQSKPSPTLSTPNVKPDVDSIPMIISPKSRQSLSESTTNTSSLPQPQSSSQILTEEVLPDVIESEVMPDGEVRMSAEERDKLFAQSLADAESEAVLAREAKNNQAAPVWSNLFAKKAPPLCTVHQKECKDYIVKVPGPNKGKRFWLCSMPVGPGYDMGRSRRPRQDVNPEFRCDFFLWDSANSKREPPRVIEK